MKQILFLIKSAIVILVVSVVLRLSGYDYFNPIPVVGVTPAALHRFVDTLFLGAIALALVEIYQALGGRSSGEEDKEKKQQ
jgi:hypothetical protein